jgi:ribosome production factor 1
MLASLFPQQAQHEGRRLATFHNQRDFIFFRQHRYVFADGGKGVRLQELGPRFTLKLKWLLAGTVAEAREGQYEWFHKRHRMETSRRKFNL